MRNLRLKMIAPSSSLYYLLGVSLVLALTAFVQPLTPAAALERFFTAPEVQADWFAEDFLAQAPLAQITALRQQITERLGAFQRIEGAESPFTVIFAQGNATAVIAVNDAGQIAGLRLIPAQQATNPNPTAPAVTPKAALERLFTSATLEDAWFSDAFLAQVSPTQIEERIAQWTKQFGDFVQVEGESSPFTVRLANATISAEITLDSGGRIIGLFFHPPIPTMATLDEAVAHFAALPGDVSVFVARDGEPLAALNADEPLAVGSAFKLAILAALQDQINAGEHTWDEVVQLDPVWKSLPSGILQDWPAESPLTLHTLATLMISISDNTAADTLLHVVGRDAVEEYTARNRPFLTTQEAFKLKAMPNADLLTAYQAGNETAQRQVLTELADRPLPTLSDFPSTPSLDIEWFFTSGELCELMAQVQALDLMTVNSGPAIATPARRERAGTAVWQRIAYKGGSETGVLNLTYWLQSNDAAYCVVATQNRRDADIDQVQFFGLTSALIGTLAPSAPITAGAALSTTAAVTVTAPVTATEAVTATNALTATLTPTATGAVTTTGNTNRCNDGNGDKVADRCATKHGMSALHTFA